MHVEAANGKAHATRPHKIRSTHAHKIRSTHAHKAHKIRTTRAHNAAAQKVVAAVATISKVLQYFL